MRYPREDTRSKPRRRRLLLLLLVAAVLVLVLIALAYAAARSAEVVAKGQLFPYSGATVYKIRFFDRWMVYIEGEEVRPSLDVFNTYVFVVISTVALSALALLRWLGILPSRRTTAFLGLMGLGALYLGIDELHGVHETIGHNLQFLSKIPGNRQPDGAVVVAYLIPVGAYLLFFRHRFLSSRVAVRLIGFAILMVLVSVLADFIGVRADEIAEILGAASLGGAFVVVVAKELRTALTDAGWLIPGSSRAASEGVGVSRDA